MKDRIRKVMELAGLSQQEFAARLEISPASLSSIFTGRTNPTNNHVQAIHRAFPNINVNWLMFGEGEMMVPSAASDVVSPEGENGTGGGDLFGGEGTDGGGPTDGTVSPAGNQPSADGAPGGGPLFAGDSGAVRESGGGLFDGRTSRFPLRSSSLQGGRGAGVAADPRGAYAARGGAGGGQEQRVANVNIIDRPMRKIKEIRVFFDDGTYEAFVPSGK